MTNRKRLLLRVTIALLFGLAAAVISLCAGRQQAEHSAVTYPQMTTCLRMIGTISAIEAFRQKRHHLPQDLSELLDSPAGEAYDGWYRPLEYSVHGDRYLVTSYGEDGRPGGAGLDADITSDNYKQRPGITMMQCLTRSETGGMVISEVGTGVLAAILCYFLVRRASLTKSNLVPLTAGLVAALIATIFVGGIVTLLHIPSGH